jgi:hypothetical protein
MVAAMGVGQKRFGAVRIPLDRDTGALGGPQADDLFGIDVDLRAEAAADIGRDHPQLVLRRYIVERAEHQPRDMRVLRGGPERVVILALVIDTERSTRLHRVGNQAVVDDIHFGDMGRRRDRCIGCAASPISQSKIRLFLASG